VILGREGGVDGMGWDGMGQDGQHSLRFRCFFCLLSPFFLIIYHKPYTVHHTKVHLIMISQRLQDDDSDDDSDEDSDDMSSDDEDNDDGTTPFIALRSAAGCSSPLLSFSPLPSPILITICPLLCSCGYALYL
jgi:hypothetical protein